MGDAFKILLDQLTKFGIKGMVNIIKAIATLFICLSPVFIYIILNHSTIIINFDIIICSLIIGCSFLLYFIVFFASEIFAALLLSRKIQRNHESFDKEQYFYNISSNITTIFLGVLSIIIIIIYFCEHPSIIIKMHFGDLILLLYVLTYLIVCLVFWLYLYLKYKKIISNEKLQIK